MAFVSSEGIIKAGYQSERKTQKYQGKRKDNPFPPAVRKSTNLIPP